MNHCLGINDQACIDQAESDWKEVGHSLPNPGLESVSFGLGAAAALAPAAGEWVLQNGELVYRTFDMLLNPVKNTAEVVIELKPPAAELQDIPEVVSATEKWLQSLARGFKPPKN